MSFAYLRHTSRNCVLERVRIVWTSERIRIICAYVLTIMYRLSTTHTQHVFYDRSLLAILYCSNAVRISRTIFLATQTELKTTLIHLLFASLFSIPRYFLCVWSFTRLLFTRIVLFTHLSPAVDPALRLLLLSSLLFAVNTLIPWDPNLWR